jgi:flagellar protein FliS
MTAARRYVTMQTATASKERTMVLLFEAALKHMRNGKRELAGKNRRAASATLDKACQIVLELQKSLKPEVAPKLVGELVELYTFTAARLCRAMVAGEISAVEEAERAFTPIAEGFIKAVAELAKNPKAQAAAAP